MGKIGSGVALSHAALARSRHEPRPTVTRRPPCIHVETILLVYHESLSRRPRRTAQCKDVATPARYKSREIPDDPEIASGLAIADDHKNSDDPEVADDMESETW